MLALDEKSDDHQSYQIILLGPWMSAANFIAIRQIVVALFSQIK